MTIRARRSFAVLLALGVAMNLLVLLFAATEVNRIRGDFCAFAAQVDAAAHQLPQTPGRVQAERAYVQLQDRLGC